MSIGFGGDANDGGAGDKNLLGGKGANLDGMAVDRPAGAPGLHDHDRAMCTRYYADGEGIPRFAARGGEGADGIAHIEAVTGKRFGDPANPLLVSVRSGARVSMPGMMDTVLNLGLNDETVEGWPAKLSGDARFAWDSYRRFIQMYSDVVLELDHGVFEEIAGHRQGRQRLSRRYVELDAPTIGRRWSRIQARRRTRSWASRSRRMCKEQLWGAIGAVFSAG
jgi:pyruvate,orthophosphate dikinase